MILMFLKVFLSLAVGRRALYTYLQEGLLKAYLTGCIVAESNTIPVLVTLIVWWLLVGIAAASFVTIRAAQVVEVLRAGGASLGKLLPMRFVCRCQLSLIIIFLTVGTIVLRVVLLLRNSLWHSFSKAVDARIGHRTSCFLTIDCLFVGHRDNLLISDHCYLMNLESVVGNDRSLRVVSVKYLSLQTSF